MGVKLNHSISKLIRLGVLSDVPSAQIMTLLHVVALADDNSVTKITNTKLAEIAGRTRKSIAEDIKKLEAVIYDGEPMIKKVMAVVDGKEAEVLRINPIFSNEVAVGDNKQINVEVFIDGLNKNMFTAKDIAKLFARVYQEEYGVSYVINWSRDIAVIKKGLLGKYTDSELTEIIDVAVKEYRKRWANKDYPRPTIVMLSNWLAKRASEVLSQKYKEAETVRKYEAERQTNKKVTDDTFERLFGE